MRKLKREFVLDSSSIEITSLDISSIGTYVLAGCSNGMVLLYDLTSSINYGHIIGHILAKGLHTNLLLTVKITEDNRMCFCGVQKGTSELLAIDLTKLSLLKHSTSSNKDINANRSRITSLTKTYNYSDAKLRGFTTACRVGLPSLTEYNEKATYRLACGKGIKNIHIWQFEIMNDFNSTVPPSWTCIYDVASNGMTIENINFRLAGMQLVSKSSGANLRVWELSAYNSINPTSTIVKLPYDDISNSQDMKTSLDCYAFGGTYNFSFVKLSAPKSANRADFEMPVRSAEDENGNRRKRMMRQIHSVIGTNDARHVLVLSSDGSIMYFHRKENDESTELIELTSLQYDPDIDQTWSISRVGDIGDVVLIRAVISSCKEYTTIYVDSLKCK